MADAQDGDSNGSRDPPSAAAPKYEKEAVPKAEYEKEVLPRAESEVQRGHVQEYAPVKDGIELRPKPTTDPLDPLNFARPKKWVCLAIVMWLCKSRPPFPRPSVARGEA